jgi:hypothetical protein
MQASAREMARDAQRALERCQAARLGGPDVLRSFDQKSRLRSALANEVVGRVLWFPLEARGIVDRGEERVAHARGFARGREQHGADGDDDEPRDQVPRYRRSAEYRQKGNELRHRAANSCTARGNDRVTWRTRSPASRSSET